MYRYMNLFEFQMQFNSPRTFHISLNPGTELQFKRHSQFNSGWTVSFSSIIDYNGTERALKRSNYQPRQQQHTKTWNSETWRNRQRRPSDACVPWLTSARTEHGPTRRTPTCAVLITSIKNMILKYAWQIASNRNTLSQSMAWSPREFLESQTWRGPVVMGTPNAQTRKQPNPSLTQQLLMNDWGQWFCQDPTLANATERKRAGLLLHSSAKTKRLCFSSAVWISSLKPSDILITSREAKSICVLPC